MGRRWSIGGLEVELRQLTPGHAGEVLKRHREIQQEIRDESKAADAAAEKRCEQLDPLVESVKRADAGEMDDQAAELARKALVDRFERHKDAWNADALAVTRKADAARGLLVAATLKTPRPPRADDEPEIPYAVRVIRWLSDEHGFEEPHIAALASLALAHLEECHQPRTLVDEVEVLEILGNSSAATASTTDSPPPTTGSTGPEPIAT